MTSPKQKKSWKVHKFGGSILATARDFQTVSTIAGPGDNLVVVSAIFGTTDALIRLLELAVEKKDFAGELRKIMDRHRAIIDVLLDKKSGKRLLEVMDHDCRMIVNVLQTVHFLGSYSEEIYDLVVGFGEQWSAQILAAHLAVSRKTAYVDARQVLIVSKDKQSIHVQWDSSKNAFATFRRQHPARVYVITGFIAADERGKAKTLGRNGSDFSAAIFANLVDASELLIWKDVDGIMSADPKKVPSAFVLSELTYNEVLELSYFGAKVIHPQAIAPAVEKRIPIFIRNFRHLDRPGTRIAASARSAYKIKGLTHVDHISLITIEGSGMIGVPGFAAMVFEAVHQINVSVIVISQASSEHSICFAVPEDQALQTAKHLRHRLRLELQEKAVKRISAEKDCSILAVVGENMVGMIGVTATISKALAKAGVNIKAIAQGSSERNVSLVIASADVSKALKAVHSAFYLSNKTLAIGLIGPGLIGRTLLQQIQQQQHKLEEQMRLSVRVLGIMDSRNMLLDERGISLKNWAGRFQGAQLQSDVAEFCRLVASDEYPHKLIIDCTSDLKISKMYKDFIQRGLHVITPNKKANSAPFAEYQALMNAVRRSQCQYYYETTVCAGLPVINTLQDLLATGDEIIEIEGIFSGTLAFIFHHFREGSRFSAIVGQARERGYTEPDPRDDLSGMDIARKVVILAREIGLKIELEDVTVKGLVPEKLRTVGVAEFMERLPEYDGQMNDILRKARQKNEILRYVGHIRADGRVTVELKSFPPDHPFANLKESDNIVSFRTRRYDSQPLVVQGPGAGAEVTAAGIFADILRLVRSLE